jgi:phosphoenolpyruvate-protein phosphotransferase (PTS system enzyme I)
MRYMEESREIKLSGISASPGICIGKAYLVGREGVDVIKKYPVDEKDLDKEIKRFKSSVKKTKDELQNIIENSPSDFRQNANILETHALLLKDKMLYGSTIETIENEKVNAEWALKKVVSKIKLMFEGMADEYFRERGSDIVHVSDRIMRNLVGQEQVNIREINKRVILVANDLSPAQTSQIQLERIMGFITERGGKASHTGIIAQTLEIPAVLGLGKKIGIIQHDDIIIVDGSEGVVIVSPSDETLIRYEEKIDEYEAFKARINREAHLPGKTQDNFAFNIMGNIELPEEVVSVLDYGGDGIGLYRTEFQYLSKPEFPTEMELFEKYKDVVDVMKNKSITIRTLDINGDKAISQTNETEEINPALGLRAIRYCLKKPDIFKTQLRAILRVAAYGNVRVLFPLISCVEEIKEAKRLLCEAAESLHSDGVVFNKDFEVGVMIEVPSAVIVADSLAKEVDFFSIGTNDLIQYALAMDRGNFEVAYMYQPLHPAILRMLKHVTDIAHKNHIKIFICGEMAAEPLYVPLLLAMGFDELSMNPQSIPTVKRMVRSVRLEDCKKFLNQVMKLTEIADINDIVHTKYGKLLEQKIYSE